MEVEEEMDLLRYNRNMIDHVFLHRKLPDEPVDLHQTELNILQLMAQTIETFEELNCASVPSVVQRLFTKMMQLHCVDRLEPTALSKQMEKLKRGEMLAIYVRAQNCGLFIHATKDDEATLSTFRASLPNETIYGDNINGEIQFDYPTRAITVKLSAMLKSEDFAMQINFLNDTAMGRAMPISRKVGREFPEVRNVPHPMYVSQWLMGVASDRDSNINNEYPVISKKIRDEVIKAIKVKADKEHEVPFRRSGFYTAMKVFLQLSLTIEMGAAAGRFVYKLVMLKFMSQLCQQHSVDADIVMQMTAKMARRMEKIANYDELGKLGNDLSKLMNVVFADVGKTIRNEREKLDERFGAIQAEKHRTSQLIALPRLPFERDIDHKIAKLLAYIEKRNAKSLSDRVDNYPKPRHVIRHAWQNMTVPDVNLLKKVTDEVDVLQLLADFEHWVLVAFDENYSKFGASQLRQFASAYMAKANSFYKNDCFGYSKLVLVMLKIIQVMDMIAVQEHKLLLTHSSGINPKIIENLLLPSQFYLRVAKQLQIYFEDRNANAQYPGLLEENKISVSSFSVRFAECNSEMQQVRQAILAMGERRVEEKRTEWQKARETVQEMRSRESRMDHTNYTNRWGSTRHCRYCPKCSLDRQIREYKVELYERPLKPEAYNQNAVVFELIMPPKIECLRDVLHQFVNKHYNPSVENVNTHGKWSTYSQISSYARSHPENVFLASSTVLVKNSDFGRGKHPDREFDEFIVDNGYNCTFYAGQQWTLPVDISRQSVKNHVTFSVESGSVYSKLQWTLSATSHTQNSVLTKQNECPHELSLNEFINFGSLRADGHRLQLRNLYRALETEGLSFETQSVLALVMQSLWEAGPLDAARSQWYRESHEDFADAVFAMEMISLLEKYVPQQESNWKHPLKLIGVATMATKMFEISSDETIIDRIVKLLIRIREIIIDWISSITETIGKCHDEESRAVVYANLMEVAIGGVFTYNVSRHHPFFEKVFSDGPDLSSLFAWFRFIVTINNNILLRGNQHNALKRTLSRLVYNIGENAQAKIESLIEKTPDDVYKFVRDQWSESRMRTFEPIQHCEYSPQIIFMAVRGEDDCSYVQIDVISGEFLVNNLPVARLPKSITDHKLFQRVFAATIFEVQPSNRSFSTVYQYDGFNYIFRMDNERLIITEQRPSSKFRELLPPEKLADEIPYLLVKNFSHWWDSSRNIVEFRPKTFGSKDFSTPIGVQYVLNLRTRHLMHLKTQKLLLDICSQSYQRIIKFLSRLEQSNYIHVLMDDPAKAKVHLMRMNLKFVIDCTKKAPTYDVESNEYRGMRVSLNQTLGTLIGLRHGMLLEAVNKSNSKVFIVPHGEIDIREDDRHVSVDIELVKSTLRKPTFFIFHVDNECRQVKANNFPGWFYLAYLHAVTSYALPDPFTGMTGTERALQILQSARVWSPSPYDAESISTLRSIAALTPLRTFYPPRTDLKVMQQIRWPAAISSASAQDSYLLIVQKLIADSQRLPQLFFQENMTKIKPATILPLNTRDYARHLPNNSNWNISKSFIQPENKLMRFGATEADQNVAAVRQLAAIYAENSFVIPSNVDNSIFQLLIGKRPLQGASAEAISNVIDFASSTNLSNLWIRLYDSARLVRLTRECFQLILSFLAYEGNDLRHLYILQAIAANAHEFADIRPPPFQEYAETARYEFEKETIKGIVEMTEIGIQTFLEQKLTGCGLEKYLEREQAFRIEYADEVESVTESVANYVKSRWPCDGIGRISHIESKKLRVNDSCAEIDVLLRMWNNNRKLVLFIRQVEAKLKQLLGNGGFSPIEWPIFNVGEKPFPKYVIDFEEKLSRNFEFRSPRTEGDMERARQIFVEASEENERSLADWWRIFENLSVPSNARHLVDSGLYPRLIPSLIFPKLLESICDRRKFMIGAIAVMTTREQRTQRIGRFEHQPQMEMILRRERENQPYVNWMPYERPEWLLFEIEMDLSIRRIQVEIANRMFEPPGQSHSVMQLNMGEGKTAVIVPILAAVLADGKQLCSVTVLKSLFQTNLRSLRQCLGGMLNRRIYTFPCRRDMHIEAVAAELLPIYEECKRERGVLMTLPEYRLSFQLKVYEAARKGETAHATDFLNVHKWLNQNARHILDESDAILDPKYQLIYTVGAQLPPDGGALRWKIIQAVLKRVPFHMRRLFQSHGEQAIEFNENYKIGGVDYGCDEISNRPEVFRPCRLLNESNYNELSDALIDDFLNGELNVLFPETLPDIREHVRIVLRDPNIGHEQHAALINRFEDTSKKTILILSGLFKFEVLKLSLMKRWRVNYGVNSTGSRKMAVPFRAKDVAAEMTEFGHPDVAICLTHFSYYYSGLSDEQLYETFNVLRLTENPEEIYDEWVGSIPGHLVPDSIVSYNSINLSDPGQRDTQLFPLLRFNMHVIDYWLSKMVFPREAKIFEGKLMCTAWDLCTEHLERIVTGFSGTNDTKLVLPMPIVQNDLLELEATNESVRQILLRPENDHYRRLRSNVSGMEILRQLFADGIPVLLDAGALMLELNNEQVAREWLKLLPIANYDAAIFFSKDDILMTIDRNDFITEFEYSVYRERLGRCLVYLDDVHTRGTDLRFPSGIRACVTLSGHITRDKTVQACMRMRMLGEGHMVSFYASLEADSGIRSLNNIRDDERVNTLHVVQYICNNSEIFEKDGLVHWSAAGLNYAQKLAAHKCFEGSLALNELSARCTDPENSPLIEMYGAKEVQKLTEITQSNFSRLAHIYSEHQAISNWINVVGEGVVLKLKTHIGEALRYTQLLDEEQEKELEHELEEQREVSRPPPMVPITPQLNPLLRALFILGKSHDSYTELRRTNGIRKLPFAFAKTTLYSFMEPQLTAWDDQIFVTRDFLSVAKLAAHDRDDEFIRPVWWIARVGDPNNNDVLVLLSTFECNALVADFRSSKKSILYMFCPKLSISQSNLLNNANLQVPANPSNGNIAAAKAVQIAMFAGSMYFNDHHEETAYCNFMGFIPRPRNSEHQQAFEEGAITSNGYVPLAHRRRFVELFETCRFTKNPDKTAIGIIERRHGYLSAKSHVALLLVEGKRAQWNN